MSTWTLIEPCCGSAAFTLHLLGARAAIVPYQGSKWRFRHGLADAAARLGFHGCPARVVLSDPGPWGRVLSVVLDPGALPALIAGLELLAAEDAAAVFGRLQGGEVPADPVRFAAEFLFLQRLSFSGKAVGTRGGRWVSPGFNTSSAYGIRATDRFGEVRPMVPGLVRVLRGYARLARPVVAVHNERASAPRDRCGHTLVYLDPPYAGSTRYPDGAMTREEVVALAEAWRAAGAAVLISEQHGLDLPGWRREQLHAGRADTSPFRGKQQEWLTWAAAW